MTEVGLSMVAMVMSPVATVLLATEVRSQPHHCMACTAAVSTNTLTPLTTYPIPSKKITHTVT